MTKKECEERVRGILEETLLKGREELTPLALLVEDLGFLLIISQILFYL